MSRKEECQICFDELPRHLFLQITADCNHELDICKTCVDRHIQAQLESKGEICCPSTGCGKEIKHRDVKRIASRHVFERFDKLTLNQALSKLPEFRWCKNSKCGSGQISYGRENSPIMTCESCGHKYCYTHDVPWHEGLTCSEYDNRKIGEDRATKDLLRRETKPCPKCGVRITKNGGCDHMTCTVKSCRYEFCWLCLADFDQIRRHGNAYHKRSCSLYA